MRYPQSAVTLYKLPSSANHEQRNVTIWHEPHLLVQQTEFLKAAVSSQVSSAQGRSSWDLDNIVQREAMFKIKDYEFVDCPQLLATASDVVNEIANSRYDKFIWRIWRSYWVLIAQLHTSTIEERGIQKNTSINLLVLSPTWAQQTAQPHKTMQILRPRHRDQQQQNDGKDAKRAGRNDATLSRTRTWIVAYCAIGALQKEGGIW